MLSDPTVATSWESGDVAMELMGPAWNEKSRSGDFLWERRKMSDWESGMRGMPYCVGYRHVDFPYATVGILEEY